MNGRMLFGIVTSTSTVPTSGAGVHRAKAEPLRSTVVHRQSAIVGEELSRIARPILRILLVGLRIEAMLIDPAEEQLNAGG